MIKKINVFTSALAWACGIIFIIGGMIELSESNFGGLLIIIGAIIILPPFGNFIKKRFNFELKGWLKLVAFLILIVIGMSMSSPQSPLEDVNDAQEPTTLSKSSSQPAPQEVKNTPEPISLFEGDTSIVLPTREEIATEWVIESQEEEDVEVEGFVSGNRLEISRLETVSASLGSFVAYKFENVDSANNYYSREVSEIKQKGGYTELSCSGIDADCFCKKSGSISIGYSNWAICKKKNVVFWSEVASFNLVRTPYFKTMAEVMAKKI